MGGAWLLLAALTIARAPPRARARTNFDYEFIRPQDRISNELNFAEIVYAKMSSACRAIMDMRYNNDMKNQTNITKKINIIIMLGNTTKSFPVDEAYKALIQSPNFDIRKQTKIIIHGYKDRAMSAVPLDLANAYNEKGIFNVLLVDAEELLDKGYILAANNVRLIGKRLANLLANLDYFGTKAEDFHLIGISLGAHIAGWTAKYFRQYKIQTLGRITGLDPAGPCFSLAPSDQRLDYSDANYVDVVHSNRLVQGVIEPLGHADFYLNGGGPNQPGCMIPSCSHLRAAQVYVESIRIPKSFVGIGCQNWSHFISNTCHTNDYAVLGYGSSLRSRGLYFLRTKSDSPYGLGIEGTRNIEPKVIERWLRSLNFD